MKRIIIAYISLLIYCGLILIFCNPRHFKKTPVAVICPKTIKASSEKAVIRGRVQFDGFSFIKDIASDLFPLLKKLNQM